MRRFGLLVMLFAAGCATQAASSCPGDYKVTWSVGHSSEPGSPDVPCGAELAHPCSYMLFARTFTIADDGSAFVWRNATGAKDTLGNPVGQAEPVVEPQTFAADGSIMLAMRGDESGERRAAMLKPTANGYAGDVTWSLFTVGGNTTFHVVLAP